MIRDTVGYIAAASLSAAFLVVLGLGLAKRAIIEAQLVELPKKR